MKGEVETHMGKIQQKKEKWLKPDTPENCARVRRSDLMKKRRDGGVETARRKACYGGDGKGK